MSFLSTWIDSGLMGLFTIEHAGATDEEFYEIYRSALERRIAGEKPAVENDDLLAWHA